MAEFRLTDLQPDRQEVHVSLNITNPESVDFGWARSSQTPRPTIVPINAVRGLRIESFGSFEESSTESPNRARRSSFRTQFP